MLHQFAEALGDVAGEAGGLALFALAVATIHLALERRRQRRARWVEPRWAEARRSCSWEVEG